MSYQSRRMNLLFTLNIIILLVKIGTTQTRMCYVCGIGSEEPFENSKSTLQYPMNIPLSCNEFEQSADLEKYMFTCPPNYVGCITQARGMNVMRTCESLAIDDCQIANGVQYCYCTTDLCNKKQIKDETYYDDDDTSDIDDSFESSGSSIDRVSDDTIVPGIEVSSTSSVIPIIEPRSPIIVTRVTHTEATTTTEASTVTNKIFTATRIPTSASPTSASTNATSNQFVKFSNVIFIMHILMLIFLL